jgi:electron transport complex protein RnfG
MKKDFIAPIAVLFLICAITTGVLAATNGVTAPVIEAAARKRADEARIAILPSADGFEELAADGLPEGVTEAYAATNGAGYVFASSGTGYGGAGSILLMIAVSPDGTILGVTTLANNETQGLGSRVSEPLHEGQFIGMDASLEGYEAVTGATISSEAYRGAVLDALRAFEITAGDGGAAE